MVNYNGNLMNNINNSNTNYDSSALFQRKNEQDNKYNNEVTKDYIHQQNEIKNNNENAHERNNLFNNENNNPNINTSRKIIETPQLTQENNAIDNNNQHKNKLRPEKDNKCCLIF